LKLLLYGSSFAISGVNEKYGFDSYIAPYNNYTAEESFVYKSNKKSAA
jgi:hypothetical protein